MFTLRHSGPARVVMASVVALATVALVLPRPSASQTGAQPPSVPAKTTFDPTDHYEVRRMQGWTVLVNKSLLAQQDLASLAVHELESQLYLAARRFPPKA